MKRTLVALAALVAVALITPSPAKAGVSVAIGLPGFGLYVGAPYYPAYPAYPAYAPAYVPSPVYVAPYYRPYPVYYGGYGYYGRHYYGRGYGYGYGYGGRGYRRY